MYSRFLCTIISILTSSFHHFHSQQISQQWSSQVKEYLSSAITWYLQITNTHFQNANFIHSVYTIISSHTNFLQIQTCNCRTSNEHILLHIMKLLIMHLSPASCHFLLLQPNTMKQLFHVHAFCISHNFVTFCNIPAMPNVHKDDALF